MVILFITRKMFNKHYKNYFIKSFALSLYKILIIAYFNERVYLNQ